MLKNGFVVLNLHTWCIPTRVEERERERGGGWGCAIWREKGGGGCAIERERVDDEVVLNVLRCQLTY